MNYIVLLLEIGENAVNLQVSICVFRIGVRIPFKESSKNTKITHSKYILCNNHQQRVEFVVMKVLFTIMLSTSIIVPTVIIIWTKNLYIEV